MTTVHITSPTDQPERRSPYALFLEATDRQPEHMTAVARRINEAIVVEGEVIRIGTIRSNRPIVAVGAVIVQRPIIVATITHSGITVMMTAQIIRIFRAVLTAGDRAFISLSCLTT